MQLDWLADELRAAGLDVREYSGWKTRTMRPFSEYTPVGVIDHHTAGSSVLTNYPSPPYWDPARLLDKCNITIQPDGVVWVLNAGLAWDSGNGSSKVLAAVRADQPLPSLAGLTSDTAGSPWFIDIEVQHLGDGSPLPAPARTALIRTNAAICKRMDWDPRYRVIGHREWAPDRKVDPRWDGLTNPMPKIRTDTYNLIGDDMPTPDEVVDALLARHIPVDIPAGQTRSIGTILQSLRYDAQKAHTYAKKTWTKVAAGAVGGATATQIVNEIVNRLAN